MIRRLCLSLLLSIPLLAADYDLLIRNARVVDGAGNPWFRADVAVKNGKIAAIGRLAAASAARSIDAQGRVIGTVSRGPGSACSCCSRRRCFAAPTWSACTT